MRCAVTTAVPDGASAFASWWSSIISAVSNHGAAISAKRIINTAPIAKFAAINALADEASKAPLKLAKSSSLNPVVPTTQWTPFSAHHSRLERAAERTVKSTTTSAPASSSACGEPAMTRSAPGKNSPIDLPEAAGSIAATSSNPSASITALQTAWPIRPAAPNTPTRVIRRGYPPKR